MHPVSCTNTHDVTNLLNHGMVKNTKTWISREWNITFLRNKIIFNLWLWWHILKRYRFVAEVTFKVCQRCSVLVLQYKRLFQWVWSEYFINEIARKKVSGGRYSCTSYIYLKAFITEIKVEINEKLKMVSLYESHLCKQP